MAGLPCLDDTLKESRGDGKVRDAPSRRRPRGLADETALASADGADAVCFGSLAQRGEPSRSAIRSMVSAARPGAIRLFDVNLRPPFVDHGVIEESLTLANALKLNDQELPELAAM